MKATAQKEAEVVSKPSPLWTRTKLTLRWIVYEDQFGNFVVVDPHRPKTLGLDRRMVRPPMVCIAATDDELENALEEMLFVYEQQTAVNSRHLSLVERVDAARSARGSRTDDRLPRLPKAA